MPTAAHIMLNWDSARSRHEPSFYAEIIVDPGEHETVLYTTPYHADFPAAIADAERWMRENGVVEAEV